MRESALLVGLFCAALAHAQSHQIMELQDATLVLNHRLLVCESDIADLKHQISPAVAQKSLRFELEDLKEQNSRLIERMADMEVEIHDLKQEVEVLKNRGRR